MAILKRIAHMCVPYKKCFVVGLVALVITCVSRLIAPLIMGELIDKVIGAGRHELLFSLCAGMIGLVVVRAGTGYIRGIQFEKLSQGFTYDLRTGLYKHLQTMAYEFYDKNYVGEIMSRMTGDIEGLRNLLAMGMVQIIENAMWFGGSLVILFFLDARLALVIFIFAPAVAIVAYFFRKQIRPAFQNIREQNAVLSTRTQENISGVRVVKAFAQEAYEEEIFRGENQKLLKLHLAANMIRTNFVPVLELLSNITTPVLLLAGGFMVIRGDITLGTLVVFMNFTWMITGPMRNMGAMVNMLVNAMSSAEKLFFYADLGPSIKDRQKTAFPDNFTGHVVFDDVSFSYGDGAVLKHVSFEAKPGQTIAVMGATGTGKTSLVNLMARFYQCQSGRVSIDGIDVKDMPIKELRAHIGFVPQETFLFSETIAANIAFGREDATLDEIKAAASLAQADAFITETTDGYETIVGERGMGLSGGQKQRVSIARALLYNPTVLVMDDSTSAVDMQTEYELQKGLKAAMQNRTTFIIAHRISSVKDADMILVLDGHTIAERGTHSALLAKEGLYYEMYQEQYKSFAKPTQGEVR